MINFTASEVLSHSYNSLPSLSFRVTEDSLVSVVLLVPLDLLVPVDPLDLPETMVLR